MRLTRARFALKRESAILKSATTLGRAVAVDSVSGPITSAAPTLEDVARVAGVSRATVSRVVNGKRRVASDIQDRVRAAIEETGYVPNLAARRLVTGRNGSVALIVSGAGIDPESAVHGAVDFADPFFGRVIGGIMRALRPLSIEPVLMLVETEADRARVMSSIRTGNTDGALLVTTHGADPLPQMLADASVPTVKFARPTDAIQLSYVDVSHRDGAALAAAHLVERGRVRTAIIAGPAEVPAAEDRMAGFREAMSRFGQAFVPMERGVFTLDTGFDAMKRLLEAHPDIDGVFASNDLMALGAIQAIREAGKSVPGDISVVGFDDSSICELSIPRITSVRQPIEEMSGEMSRILAEMLSHPNQPVTSMIFESELIIREST